MLDLDSEIPPVDCYLWFVVGSGIDHCLIVFLFLDRIFKKVGWTLLEIFAGFVFFFSGFLRFRSNLSH